jgi:hypothetical protein
MTGDAGTGIDVASRSAKDCGGSTELGRVTQCRVGPGEELMSRWNQNRVYTNIFRVRLEWNAAAASKNVQRQGIPCQNLLDTGFAVA